MKHFHVTNRNKFIYHELSKVGIDVCSFSSDGAAAFIKSQRICASFGVLHDYKCLKLIGLPDSKIMGYQDATHILKKMQSRLFDVSYELILGDYIASVTDLEVVYTKFSKHQHKLNKNDLNVLDRMNYR
jgi:cob(I)alamin adenosyltransferase